MNYKNETNKNFVISPQSSETRWVALDYNDVVIAEGKTPDEAIEKAKKITSDYLLMFVPLEDNTYFF